MKRIRVHFPEIIFAGLGILLTASLTARAGLHGLSFPAFGLLLAYLTAVRLTRLGSRVRLMANYFAAWALYAGSSAVVVALHVPLQQERLLAWDTWLFGGAPAAMMQGLLPPWMNDVLSLGYLSYHFYLHWALIEALFKSEEWRCSLGRLIFSAFALGFPGYYLFPAAPPAEAFPGLFGGPVAGGWPTHFNESVDAGLAARFDAFPSLHLLVTLALMTWDWRGHRRRFWIMLVPSLSMVMATLALRLHYAVDLLAALALYGLLLLLVIPNPPSTHDACE